jgi:hypothetical protein
MTSERLNELLETSYEDGARPSEIALLSIAADLRWLREMVESGKISAWAGGHELPRREHPEPPDAPPEGERRLKFHPPPEEE